MASMPSSQELGKLLHRLYDADPDLRYMALSDLHKIMVDGHPSFLAHDYNTSAKVIDGLLATLNDTSGEVQNQAVKCLGPFVNKVPESIVCPMIDKISQLSMDNSVDSSIPALALRTIVVSLPRPAPGISRSSSVLGAYASVSKALIPRLVGYTVVSTGRKDLPKPPTGMLETDIAKGMDSNAMDVLVEVVRCFGPLLVDAELVALQKEVLRVLQSDRASAVLKKKAVTAISALAVYLSDANLSSLISHIIEGLRDAHLTRSKRKLYINILGSMARSLPRKFGPYLKTLTPFVISALSQSELDEEMEAWDGEDERDPESDEVREAALTALEGFLASCTQDMRLYTEESIDAGTRFLKYDPNLATDDDDEAMDDEDDVVDLEDEDFEEEGGDDDEDDASWKVRRCAAKVLYTLIATRSNGDLLEDGTLYGRVAPALIPRFKEREESVRLEVLATLTCLIRLSKPHKTPSSQASADGVAGLMGPPANRKRRRVGSDASMTDYQTNASLIASLSATNDAQPMTVPQKHLAAIVPEIVNGIVPLLKTGTLPTKQASMGLLKSLVLTQNGGLADYLGQIMDPVIECAKVSSSSSPYLATVVPTLAVAAKDRYSKVSSEALAAVEGLVKALTQSRASGSQNKGDVENLFEILVNRIAANDADVDARRRAINVLGLLIGRSSGSEDLLIQPKRTDGLDLLAERLRHEVTRLAAVRAIEVAAGLCQNSSEVTEKWIQVVSMELVAQLRKASRSLRGASLSTLRTIVINPATRIHLNPSTTQEIEAMLLPPIKSNDLHLMGPALVILATFVSNDLSTTVNKDLVAALKEVVTAKIGGSALEALLTLVRAISEKGHGGHLMQTLLQDVGVAGDPDLVGKVIGTLLVYSPPGSIPVNLDAFVNELNTAKDSKRQSLALAVLGEAGLRLHAKSPLQPKVFMSHFRASGPVPLAAAVALGRAGAGNIKTYLPFILSEMSQKGSQQYLFLHSLREILQHKSADADLLPYAQEMWKQILQASQAEDNKAVGAECMGKLTIIDAKTFLPQLQKFLAEPTPGVRGMVISALRYTFSDTDETYDDYLRPIVIPMLTRMLQEETNLENQRLALTTMSSAVHNKPDIVMPNLDQLLPLAMQQTVIKPELIREVQMGPFKHKVDDGLEVRKSAYETVYTLIETAFSKLNVPDFYDRIIAGISDEYDVMVLCNLMLTKLVHLAPDETKLRLSTIAEHFKSIISVKPKDNAVKQEVEKIDKSAKGVVKVSLDVNRSLGVGSSESVGDSSDSNVKAWGQYWDWIRKEHSVLVKAVEEELRAEKDR
ncbi:TIP120-domain-containing protein [Saccharata proteae CBS 121410]|uniref:TIP120-domain-containing protein n=1 Tax=Saccharata proteae CBS 121410 TaxID=1314787 RepID=A0A9P4HNW8_9PEZI|nr:TIP120-domain-containing protein [Saccharata proteae CBS 121410]